MIEPDWQSEDGSIRLYRGDCLEVMPALTETVDCICTDLPYGTTACKWDTVIPFEPLWASYKRVIKPKGAIVLFGSQPFTTSLVASNMKDFKYELLWLKTQGREPQLCNIRPMKAHENILVFCSGKTLYNPQLTAGIPYSKTQGTDRDKPKHLGTTGFTGLAVSDKAERFPLSYATFAQSNSGLHPTQKPVALLEYLIKTYTNAGETVLDNTFGSGTAAVACINTGRKFIGIEKSPEYFDQAVERLTNHLAARTESLFPNDEAPAAV